MASVSAPLDGIHSVPIMDADFDSSSSNDGLEEANPLAPTTPVPYSTSPLSLWFSISNISDNTTVGALLTDLADPPPDDWSAAAERQSSRDYGQRLSESFVETLLRLVAPPSDPDVPVDASSRQAPSSASSSGTATTTGTASPSPTITQSDSFLGVALRNVSVGGGGAEIIQLSWRIFVNASSGGRGGSGGLTSQRPMFYLCDPTRGNERIGETDGENVTVWLLSLPDGRAKLLPNASRLPRRFRFDAGESPGMYSLNTSSPGKSRISVADASLLLDIAATSDGDPDDAGDDQLAPSVAVTVTSTVAETLRRSTGTGPDGIQQWLYNIDTVTVAICGNAQGAVSSSPLERDAASAAGTTAVHTTARVEVIESPRSASKALSCLSGVVSRVGNGSSPYYLVLARTVPAMSSWPIVEGSFMTALIRVPRADLTSNGTSRRLNLLTVVALGQPTHTQEASPVDLFSGPPTHIAATAETRRLWKCGRVEDGTPSLTLPPRGALPLLRFRFVDFFGNPSAWALSTTASNASASSPTTSAAALPFRLSLGSTAASAPGGGASPTIALSTFPPASAEAVSRGAFVFDPDGMMAATCMEFRTGAAIDVAASLGLLSASGGLEGGIAEDPRNVKVTAAALSNDVASLTVQLDVRSTSAVSVAPLRVASMILDPDVRQCLQVVVRPAAPVGLLLGPAENVVMQSGVAATSLIQPGGVRRTLLSAGFSAPVVLSESALFDQQFLSRVVSVDGLASTRWLSSAMRNATASVMPVASSPRLLPSYWYVPDRWPPVTISFVSPTASGGALSLPLNIAAVDAAGLALESLPWCGDEVRRAASSSAMSTEYCFHCSALGTDRLSPLTGSDPSYPLALRPIVASTSSATRSSSNSNGLSTTASQRIDLSVYRGAGAFALGRGASVVNVSLFLSDETQPPTFRATREAVISCHVGTLGKMTTVTANGTAAVSNLPNGSGSPGNATGGGGTASPPPSSSATTTVTFLSSVVASAQLRIEVVDPSSVNCFNAGSAVGNSRIGASAGSGAAEVAAIVQQLADYIPAEQSLMLAASSPTRSSTRFRSRSFS